GGYATLVRYPRQVRLLTPRAGELWRLLKQQKASAMRTPFVLFQAFCLESISSLWTSLLRLSLLPAWQGFSSQTLRPSFWPQFFLRPLQELSSWPLALL